QTPAAAPMHEQRSETAPRLLKPKSVGRKPPAVVPTTRHIQSTFLSTTGGSDHPSGVSIPRPGRERLSADGPLGGELRHLDAVSAGPGRAGAEPRAGGAPEARARAGREAACRAGELERR